LGYLPDNKNESRETNSEKEINQETLELEAAETKHDVEQDYERGHQIVEHLAKQAINLSQVRDLELEDTKTEIRKSESIIKEITSDTENKIDQESQEPSLEHLPNYLADSEEAKLVEMIPASAKVQERFNEKISPDMKEAIATVAGKVFNNCKYPYALIGSNCYVPHTEYSEKIPDDLDVIFGIKDKDEVYAELMKMQAEGSVKELSMTELHKFGKEKNGCFKIHCFIKTSTGYKEMEAFAQHMQDEVVNEGKNTNGVINLGVDQQAVEVVDVGGVKVNIGNEKMAEELYLKNTINEFALYDLNGWENRGILNAKALQRIFNIINLDSQKFEDSIELMIENIGKIKPQTEQAKIAQESIKHLWEKFKSLPKTKDEGLVNHLMETNNIKLNDGMDNHEKKIISTEKAVDIITAETKADMTQMSDNYDVLHGNCAAVLNNPKSSPEEINKAIDKIGTEVKSLRQIDLKYKNYLNQVNSADKNDFCVYAAMPQLINNFILPIVTRLMKQRRDLKQKIK